MAVGGVSLRLSHVDVARTYGNMGCVEESVEGSRISREVPGDQNKKPRWGHVRVAETEENMVIVYQKMGEFEKALETYKKVLETKCRTYGHFHASVATTKQNIGVLYQHKGDQTSANVQFKEAFDIFMLSLGPD
jgi:hypothetical protein